MHQGQGDSSKDYGACLVFRSAKLYPHTKASQSNTGWHLGGSQHFWAWALNHLVSKCWPNKAGSSSQGHQVWWEGTHAFKTKRVNQSVRCTMNCLDPYRSCTICDKKIKSIQNYYVIFYRKYVYLTSPLMLKCISICSYNKYNAKALFKVYCKIIFQWSSEHIHVTST